MTYSYNKSTINKELKVIFESKSEYNDDSTWKIILKEPIYLYEKSQYIPKETEFNYVGNYEDTKDDVTDYIQNVGIAYACNLDDAKIESFMKNIEEETYQKA